jgi:hypoxanthine-DNA glycosylase
MRRPETHKKSIQFSGTGKHRAFCFLPFVPSKSQTLILGSMPGVRSLEEQRYYAHPQNQFWKIMGALFDMPVGTYAQRLTLIKKNKLSLWDVFSSCERRGSLDSNIDPDTIEVNDFEGLLNQYPHITRIFFNGATAEKEFARRVIPRLPHDVAARLRMKRLPSTSPAHAGMKVENKLKEWSAIKGT